MLAACGLLRNREIVLLVPEPSPAYINYRRQSFASFAGTSTAPETEAAVERVRMFTMDEEWGVADTCDNEQWHKCLPWGDYLNLKPDSDLCAYVAFAELVLRAGKLCYSEPRPLYCL
jgi:hypothetical protein